MRDRHGIEPAEATEAVNDPNAVWIEPDPASTDGNSLRVIGLSSTRQQVVSVVLVRRSHSAPPAGGWWGANGWVARPRDQRWYFEGSTEHE